MNTGRMNDIYMVDFITYDDCKDWLLYKHYAKRIPSISFSFGLFKDKKIVGVCTFGMPPNYIEMEAWKPYNILELNRLVINDELEKNSLSFFVSRCIKKLNKPVVLISYSDFRQGHHGYIYQATNWIYTGIGGDGQNIYIMKDGTERHQRHGDKIDKKNILRIEKTTGKARYYYFLGSKKDIKIMKEKLRFDILPYPKGDNKRYDSSYEPDIQQRLF